MSYNPIMINIKPVKNTRDYKEREEYNKPIINRFNEIMRDNSSFIPKKASRV